MYVFIYIFLFSFLLTHAEAREVTLMELEEVTDLIMSPGCDYIYTLTNCPSAEAAQMREIVKEKLQSGETKEEILRYFEEIYGPRILAQPKREGFYFTAWWFPYFLLVDIAALAALLLYLWGRRGRIRAKQVIADSEDEDLIESELRRFNQ